MEKERVAEFYNGRIRNVDVIKCQITRTIFSTACRTLQALREVLLHTHIIRPCEDVNYYVLLKNNEFTILYSFMNN